MPQGSTVRYVSSTRIVRAVTALPTLPAATTGPSMPAIIKPLDAPSPRRRQPRCSNLAILPRPSTEPCGDALYLPRFGSGSARISSSVFIDTVTILRTRSKMYVGSPCSVAQSLGSFVIPDSLCVVI